MPKMPFWPHRLEQGQLLLQPSPLLLLLPIPLGPVLKASSLFEASFDGTRKWVE